MKRKVTFYANVAKCNVCAASEPAWGMFSYNPPTGWVVLCEPCSEDLWRHALAGTAAELVSTGKLSCQKGTPS